jgi:hypothetical protein
VELTLNTASMRRDTQERETLRENRQFSTILLFLLMHCVPGNASESPGLPSEKWISCLA